MAARLLIEESPNALSQMTLLNDGRYLLETEVCNYKGIGRFVLGLCDDVEVLSPNEFQEYLRERIRFLTQKIGA